ncbi:MAG: DUF4359 domain-containing protein [Prevotellaceae bacterium]|nr:DUF4359 domain-containing protein [Prevotellaceae bacterium]
MSKTLIGLLCTALLLALMVFTCPTKEEHKETIKANIVHAIESKVTEETSNDTEFGLATLGTMFASSLVDYYLNSVLKVNNYLIFSTGELSIEGKKKSISFGILNHVFTITDEELKERIDNAQEKETKKDK